MEKLIAIEGQKKIVLVGNPNVGKSVYFHRLTGQYVDVSNFPGTTMEFYCGKLGCDFLVDTPGVYGLSGHSEEESLVRDAVLTADIVINVVDTVHLERDLFLTCQLVDTGVPMIIALNMIDELEGRGMEVDTAQMQQLLGVPVVATVAVTGQGFDLLSEKLAESCTGRASDLVEQLLAGYPGLPRGEALFILEGDPEVSSRHGLEPGREKEEIYEARRHRAGDVAAAAIKEKCQSLAMAARIGHWLINPLTGIPTLLLTLWAIYELVGVFFAQIVVGVTETIIMKGHYEPLVRALLSHVLDLHSPLGVILSGQFGLLTMAVTYLFGLLLPLVGGFFLVLSILEDSGYLPRIATLMDRVMSYLGLNGQAVIPLVLGFGCVTMAAITTRMLASDRERRIAIFLLALSVPCSAQLAFVAAILGSLGPGYMFLYGFIILSVMAGVGTIMDRLLPGYTQPLWLDLPTMRLPRLDNILKKSWLRTFGFLKEAFPIFLGGALLLSLLKVTGLMDAIERIMQPLTTGWLYLPGETAGAFIMGFIRRDFGTAGIMAIPMDPIQKFIALVTLTLFVPCIATTLVIFKERGWREGIAIWFTVLALAFIMGGLLAHVIYYAQSISPAMTLPLTALFVSIVLVLAVIAARWRRGVG